MVNCIGSFGKYYLILCKLPSKEIKQQWINRQYVDVMLQRQPHRQMEIKYGLTWKKTTYTEPNNGTMNNYKYLRNETQYFHQGCSIFPSLPPFIWTRKTRRQGNLHAPAKLEVVGIRAIVDWTFTAR